MTDMSKPVSRRTVGSYRIAVSGAYPDAGGKRLVVTLHGDASGDFISIREAGRRKQVTLDIATLYWRGLRQLAQSARRG